jgi:hypothetical protein
MGICPDLEHTTSGGGGFPGSSKWFVLDPVTLLPADGRVPAFCVRVGNGGGIFISNWSRLPEEIAQLSGSPTSSEPAEKKRTTSNGTFAHTTNFVFISHKMRENYTVKIFVLLAIESHDSSPRWVASTFAASCNRSRESVNS